jgi:hypothetical protein
MKSTCGENNTTASVGQWKQLAQSLALSTPGFSTADLLLAYPASTDCLLDENSPSHPHTQFDRLTVIYDKLGVRLIYAEGWKITEDDLDAEPRTLSIESPCGGIWELMLYSDPRDGDELADEALSVLGEEYEDLETTGYTTEFADVAASGYEIYFYHLDLLIHSRIITAPLGGQTALLLWQAEDRDFDELEPVFRAMATTLLNPHRFPSPAKDD